MTSEIMTVHQALIELKTLDKRIKKKIDTSKYCITATSKSEKVNGIDKKEFKAQIKEDFESVNDLIKRRNAIKCAVVQSNATTKIKINNEEYVIAVAIDMKNVAMEHLRDLTNQIAYEYAHSKNECDNMNRLVKEEAMNAVKEMFGKKEKDTNAEEAIKYENIYLESHSYEIVSGIDCAKIIKENEEMINKFMVEFDAALSVSNATTTITVEY